MFARQIQPIAGNDDLGAGVMTEKISDICNGHGDRFQAPRRNVDNQPLVLADAYVVQLMAHGPHMPGRIKAAVSSLVQRAKHTPHEGKEIVPANLASDLPDHFGIRS